MRSQMKFSWLLILGVLSTFVFSQPNARSQDGVMGQIQFNTSLKPLKSSGVWVDGQYVGFLGELKGMHRLRLLPGDHEIVVRQAGYADLKQKVLVEPRMVIALPVSMDKDPRFIYPDPKTSSEVRLDVEPGRAAVFLDEVYVGNVDEYYGIAHAMLVAPGKHNFKIALPGFKTFETEVTLLPRQKMAIRTDLVWGSINDADPIIRSEAPRTTSSVNQSVPPASR